MTASSSSSERETLNAERREELRAHPDWVTEYELVILLDRLRAALEENKQLHTATAPAPNPLNQLIDNMAWSVTPRMLEAGVPKPAGGMPEPIEPLEKILLWPEAETAKGETVWGMGDIERGFQNMGMEINRLRAHVRKFEELRQERDAALAAVRDAQSFVNIEQHRPIIALAAHGEKT